MKFAIQLTAGVALLMSVEFTFAYYAFGTATTVLHAAASSDHQPAPATRRH